MTAAKETRNRDIRKKKADDPTLSFRALAKLYKLDVKTVYNIVRRPERVRSQKPKASDLFY